MSSIRILTSTQAIAGDWRTDEPIWADDGLRSAAEPVSAPGRLVGVLVGAFAACALVLMATITLL